MRIALDAMGGDFAPREIVRGALQAAEDHPDHNIVLVGDSTAIAQEMSDAGIAGFLIHAPDLVLNHEGRDGDPGPGKDQKA